MSSIPAILILQALLDTKKISNSLKIKNKLKNKNQKMNVVKMYGRMNMISMQIKNNKGELVKAFLIWLAWWDAIPEILALKEGLHYVGHKPCSLKQIPLTH